MYKLIPINKFSKMSNVNKFVQFSAKKENIGNN